MPPRAALFIDQFTSHHNVPNGSPIIKYATQFGACFTFTVVCVIALVIVVLIPASTTQTFHHAAPRTAIPFTRANANFEITLRVYSSSQSVASYCGSQSSSAPSDSQFFSISGQSGFSLPFTVRTSASTVSTGSTNSSAVSTCTIAADCLGCGIVDGITQLRFQLPFDSQLVEYEVWVSGSSPSSWTRQYGLLQQLPQQLLDTQSQLQFSLMESWYWDELSNATVSGFDLSWKEYVSVVKQPATDVSAINRIQVNFRFLLADVGFLTKVTRVWTVAQVVALIVSSIAALIMGAGFAFRFFDCLLTHRIGRILTDRHGKVLGIAEPDQMPVVSGSHDQEPKQPHSVELLSGHQENANQPTHIRDDDVHAKNATVLDSKPGAVIHVMLQDSDAGHV